MKKKSYLLLSLLSLLTILFCSIIKNSNPVSAVSITGVKGIVKGVSMLQSNGGTTGTGTASDPIRATFTVNLICADGVSCETVNPTGWACWLHGAGNTLGASNIAEIHVDNCNTSGTTKTCDVWLIPSRTPNGVNDPVDKNKLNNGYAGAKKYSLPGSDECTTRRVNATDSLWCYGYQSVKGKVSATVPKPQDKITYKDVEKKKEDYYSINITYKNAEKKDEILTCETPAPYGPYKVTTTTTYKYKYINGEYDSRTKTGTTIDPNPYKKVSVTPPNEICEGKYSYDSASPSTGPFEMKDNYDVTLYYKRKPAITTKTRTKEDKNTYTLTVNYLDYTTKSAIGNCAPSKTDPYTITTTYTYKDTYQDDKIINTELINTSSTTPETATVSHPATICNGDYKYVSSVPDQTSFTMDNNYTVNLYYAKKHTLTVTHRRLVGYTSICKTGDETTSYYEDATVSNVSVTVKDKISCDTGIYDFYKIDNDNNTTHDNMTVNPKSAKEDSSARAVYRRLNTLTLKHHDFYNKAGPDITGGDQKATAYDEQTATIDPVSDDFEYGGYKYKIYGYAQSKDGVVKPSEETIYEEPNMTGDVERYAFYKKYLNLTIIPVNSSCTPISDHIVETTLEGNSVSAKTITYIGDYTFKGFAEECNNTPSELSFPSSYVYKVQEIHKHVTVYAVYETYSTSNMACPPSNGSLIQSYVQNDRFDNTGTWNLTKTYAKVGDKINFCTGYNNQYPYRNFMYPDYDYLISCNRYPNPDQATPLGYKGAFSDKLNNNYLVDSNRDDLKHSRSYRLNASTNRATQQANLNSGTDSFTNSYQTDLRNLNDHQLIGYGQGLFEEGHINYGSIKDTPTSNVSSTGLSCGKVVTSLPISSYGSSSNGARAIFPYNFANDSEIKYTGDNYLYAGDTTYATITLKVNPKENSATHTEIGGPYATVDEGDIYYRIKVSIENELSVETEPIPYSTSSNRIKINADNNVNGASTKVQKTLYIPDADPGSELCIQSSIWPVNSDKYREGTSTDPNGGWTESDRNGGAGWSEWSEKDCRTIASKPSLQAWGGNVITNGKIITNYATKYHLYGINQYDPIKNNYNNKYAFGSWGEHGIIANQSTESMASGSALAYPLGLQNPSSAKFVPLTFANYYPTTPITGEVLFGNLNKTYTSSEQTFDKAALVEKYIYNTPANIEGNTIELNQNTTINDMQNTNIFHGDNNAYYYRSDSDLTINRSELVKNSTYVIHTKDKNIRITGNLEYQDGYTTLENIPKLIIYAENGTISIDSGVNRIDAILIANTVITCSAESGCTMPADTTPTVITNQINHNTQLTINGTIIANKVIPNRTYGAGKGAGRAYNDPQVNSVTPAEIINFDTSLYRWEQYSRKNADGVSPDASLITTYVKEVAPRY